MAQGGIRDYNYEDDYFLNGDTKFDQAFDNLTSMYKTYIHADEFGRKQIDRTLHTGPDGMRAFLHDIGQDFGVENLDQRIAVFNDKDHPFTEEDLKRQEQFRQEMYDAYVALPDTEKVRCVDGLQRCRDDVDLSVGISSSQTDLDGLGLSSQEFDSSFISSRESSSKGNEGGVLEHSQTHDSSMILESRYEFLKPHLDAEWYERQGLGEKYDTSSNDKQVDVSGFVKRHGKSLKEIVAESGESKSSSIADVLKDKTSDDVVAKREQRISQAKNLFSDLIKKPSMESDFGIEK